MEMNPSRSSVLCSRMFEILHKRGYATDLHFPITHSIMQICGFVMVDDTNLIAPINESTDIDETLERIQDVLDCWEGAA